jgi:hypothetical protein
MTESQAQQDLAYIRQIMDESRSFATVGGNHFIIWGSVLALALAGTWLVASGAWSASMSLLWLVCISAGWLLTAWLRWHQSRRALATHPSGINIAKSWMALGFAMTLSFFLGTWSGSLSVAAIPGMAAAFTGVGIYLNGLLARIPWLKNLAWVWWASAALMLIWRSNSVYALMAVLMLLLYVIPGVLLNRMAARAVR